MRALALLGVVTACSLGVTAPKQPGDKCTSSRTLPNIDQGVAVLGITVALIASFAWIPALGESDDTGIPGAALGITVLGLAVGTTYGLASWHGYSVVDECRASMRQAKREHAAER